MDTLITLGSTTATQWAQKDGTDAERFSLPRHYRTIGAHKAPRNFHSLTTFCSPRVNLRKMNKMHDQPFRLLNLPTELRRMYNLQDHSAYFTKMLAS
jgi:hypothetical protein